MDFAALLSMLLAACPDGMVPTGAGSCIDRYPWPNEAGALPAVGLSAAPELADAGVGEIWDGRALCRSVGKRLCSAREWRSACLGPGGAPYPWGFELPAYAPGAGPQLACNADRAYRAPDWSLVFLRDEHEMARLSQLEPSGARAACVSASGAVDMVGQVEEWVRCSWGRDGYCLVGGHVADPARCDRAIGGHSGRWHHWSTGVRCCLGGSP